MIAVYLTSFLFLRLTFWHGNLPPFLASSYAVPVALTILLSYLSHRFLESPFLRRKDRLAGEVERTPLGEPYELAEAACPGDGWSVLHQLSPD